MFNVVGDSFLYPFWDWIDQCTEIFVKLFVEVERILLSFTTIGVHANIKWVTI